MTNSVIIDTSNFFIAERVLSNIRKKQNGKCHFCGIDFVLGDIIVSCGHRRSLLSQEMCQKTEHNLT